MLKEFKNFLMKGNVLDLAVAVIVGGAFGKITTSLVNDIIMPPIGLLLGKVNFTDLFIALNGETYASLDAAKKSGAPTLNYGVFLNTLLDFILISGAVFILIKAASKLQKKAPPLPLTTKECPNCLSIIPLKATRCAHCTSNL